MQAAQVRHYLQRATDMIEAMVFLREEKAYWNSCALLAIHSAISFSDALRVGLGDNNLSAGNHEKAVDVLQTLLNSTDFKGKPGVEHLRFLLSKKNVVAYSSKRIDYSDYQSLFTRAERFQKWAETTAKELKISGWEYDKQ